MNLISKQVSLETTNICYANCIPCPRDFFTQERKIMDMSLFKKIIDEIKNYNIELIEMCGFGEPFSDRYFFDRCLYIKESIPNVKIYTTTTLAFTNKNILSNIVRYLDMLKISIYGVTKNTYEKVHRGRCSYNNFKKNLDYLLSIKKDSQYLIGSFLCIEENEKELADWITIYEPLFDEIIVWKPHNWLYKNYRKVTEEKQQSCGRPFNGPPYISVDGSVSVCCWDINKQLKIGDLKFNTLKEILHSYTFKKVQLFHTYSNFTSLICKNCCQTNKDESNLIYSNKNRRVGEITSNRMGLV